MVLSVPVSLAAKPLDQGLEAVLLRPQATLAALPRCWTGHSGKPGELPTAHCLQVAHRHTGGVNSLGGLVAKPPLLQMRLIKKSAPVPGTWPRPRPRG